MNIQLAFLLSVVASLLSFAFIARWYVVPRLLKQPRVEALLPLILLSTLRAEGLTFLYPQITGGTLPASFAVPAAYGDLLTAGLALLAAFMLRARPNVALPLVWLFNLVGFADLVFATYKGIAVGFPFFNVGVTWFIPTVYVPLLMVSHVVIFGFLLRPAPSAQVAKA